MFFLYRYLVAPIATLILPFASLFNAKIKAGYRLRREHWPATPAGLQPIWIHASSGEFEYAEGLIRELKRTDPSCVILVTYFSPTYASAIHNFPGVDRTMPLPLDLPGPCRSFLKRMKPKMLLLARTDLWPELLTQCRESKIPIILFAYTQKSIHSPLQRYFKKWILNFVDQILCVSQVDLDNVLDLNPKLSVQVVGDTRYDQVAYRLQNAKPLLPVLIPSDDLPCFVAGSTWEEDEEVLFEGLRDALIARQIRLILVPHEPTVDHIEQIEKALADQDLSYVKFSEGKDWTDHQVLLVDRTGVLAELYQLGQFAFIGGSFRKSTHSVMEALGAGALTFIGPYHGNNREAMEFKELTLAGQPGLRVINCADDLRKGLDVELNNPAQLIEFQRELKVEFNQRLGASGSLRNLILDGSLLQAGPCRT